jgi:hypothetical protein
VLLHAAATCCSISSCVPCNLKLLLLLLLLPVTAITQHCKCRSTAAALPKLPLLLPMLPTAISTLPPAAVAAAATLLLLSAMPISRPLQDARHARNHYNVERTSYCTAAHGNITCVLLQ